MKCLNRVRYHLNQRAEVGIWGSDWEFGSPKYWRARYQSEATDDWQHSLGRDLCEEVVACMLGGHGIGADVALAAFHNVLESGVLATRPVRSEDLFMALSKIDVCRPDGRREVLTYRFARQRSVRISQAINQIRCGEAPQGELDLRDWLVNLPGIGLKTASWIVRNHLGSDAVAIIDIHLVRAGRVAGIFSEKWKLPRDYKRYEEAFLRFSSLIGARPSILDSIIWSEMRMVKTTRYQT